MAVGMSESTAHSILNAIFNNASYAVTAVYVQLHVGDPGAAGTSNVATDTTRKVASFGSPAGGVVATDAALEWDNLATDDPDTISHVSLWSASSAGTFIASGELDASKVVYDNDTLTVASGGLTVSFPLAS